MPTRPVDPERPRSADAFDQPDGYSGQDYTVSREPTEGAQLANAETTPKSDAHDLPPDEGHRARVDHGTGEVHGSGSGIGGGNPGEDFDGATPSGDSYPITGGEGTDKTPGDLGPPQRDETRYL